MLLDSAIIHGKLPQAWHRLLVSKIQELLEICCRNIGDTSKNIGDTKRGRYRRIPPVPKIQEELAVFTGITGNTGGRARPATTS